MPVWVESSENVHKTKVRYIDIKGNAHWMTVVVDNNSDTKMSKITVYMGRKRHYAELPLAVVHFMFSDNKGGTIDARRGARIVGVDF